MSLAVLDNKKELKDLVACLDKQLPLKGYVESKANKVIMFALMPYISGLLSLTDETSAKRLEIALPAIKDLCWGMSFIDITKMFEMYADNKLSIKPIPNYFDRILFGKIVEAYNIQKPRKQKKIEPYTSPDEIEFIMTEAVDRIQKDYNQNGCITEMCHHVYDHLYEKGKLPKHTTEYKADIERRAIEIYEREPIEDEGMMQDIIDNFDEETINIIKNLKKRLVLEDYFKLIQNTIN